MKRHNLKISSKYFEDVLSEIKCFEVRFNDRDFAVGDILYLHEFDEVGGYTGRSLKRKIVYLLDDLAFCKEGYVILGIRKCDDLLKTSK